MCAHPWEDGYGMTKEDRDEMQGIKDALDTDSQNKVSNAIANYKIKLFELHSGKDAWQVNMSVLKGITAKLKEVQSSIRPGYGMITKTLSDKINMLKLVRFHLMQVSNQLAYDVKNAK